MKHYFPVLIGLISLKTVSASNLFTDYLARIAWTSAPTIRLNPNVTAAVPPGFCADEKSYYKPTSNGNGALEIITAEPNKENYDTLYIYALGVPMLNAALTTETFHEDWTNPLPKDPILRTGPFEKNMGERNVVANDVCFWKSPTRSYRQCAPMQLTALQTLACVSMIVYGDTDVSQNRFLWAELAQVTCGFSYPDQSIGSSMSEGAPPGTLYVAMVDKCMSFHYAKGVWYVQLTDPWSNKYIMHATHEFIEDLKGFSLSDVILPSGWKKELLQAHTDFYVNPLIWDDPAVSGSNSSHCYNVILRDNQGNGYHQSTWGMDLSPRSSSNLFSVAMHSKECLNATVALPGLTVTE